MLDRANPQVFDTKLLVFREFGVFGGQGGVYLIDEFNRGAVGNMPASQSTDVHADIWAKLEAGDIAGARKLFNQLLPLINYERMYGIAVYKEVLESKT